MIQLLLWHQSPLFEEENDQMRCESHFQCLDLLHIYFEPRRNKFCVFVYVFNCICLIFHRCICIILTAPPYVCALNPAGGAVPSLVALERQTSKKDMRLRQKGGFAKAPGYSWPCSTRVTYVQAPASSETLSCNVSSMVKQVKKNTNLQRNGYLLRL